MARANDEAATIEPAARGDASGHLKAVIRFNPGGPAADVVDNAQSLVLDADEREEAGYGYGV